MGLIHVPAVEDARLLPEGADQSGVTFQIHHLCLAIARQTQILSGDIHENGEPLFVLRMPENLKVRIPGEKMLTGGTVSIGQVNF